MKILVVDDDKVTQIILNKLLKTMADVTLLADGSEVLNLVNAAAGDNAPFDLIILDYNLMNISGLEVLREIRREGVDVPVIILTGEGSEAVAVEAMKGGAQDYLSKKDLEYAALKRSIDTTLHTADLERQLKREQAEKDTLIKELQESLEQIRTLKGLLPICAQCKQIRDDGGYWHRIETFICDHADVSFSHSLCPQCFEEAMAKIDELKAANEK